MHSAFLVSIRVSEWVSDQGLKSQLTILESYRDWNKVYQAQWLGPWTRSCLYVVCMHWASLVLVRPTASLYSASPLKQGNRQWWSNPDHYPNPEPASRSLTPSCRTLCRTEEPHIFNVFCLMEPGIEPPTSRMPGERSTTTLPGRGHYNVWGFDHWRTEIIHWLENVSLLTSM